MKFSKFDRSNLKALRTEMEALLAKYGVDSNLDITVEGMRFSEAEVKINVIAKVKGAKTLANVILESRVGVVDVRLMMLRVVNLHRPRINVRLEAIIRIAQFGQGERPGGRHDSRSSRSSRGSRGGGGLGLGAKRA